MADRAAPRRRSRPAVLAFGAILLLAAVGYGAAAAAEPLPDLEIQLVQVGVGTDGLPLYATNPSSFTISVGQRAYWRSMTSVNHVINRADHVSGQPGHFNVVCVAAGPMPPNGYACNIIGLGATPAERNSLKPYMEYFAGDITLAPSIPTDPNSPKVPLPSETFLVVDSSSVPARGPFTGQLTVLAPTPTPTPTPLPGEPTPTPTPTPVPEPQPTPTPTPTPTPAAQLTLPPTDAGSQPPLTSSSQPAAGALLLLLGLVGAGVAIAGGRRRLVRR